MHNTETGLPDWARAHGRPVAQGRIKQVPEDFKVDEVLGFEPDGAGEHDFLLIEKTDANTNWVARQLSQHAGVATRDVGYAGLKDRRAVTSQWFSVRRPTGSGTNWNDLEIAAVRILQVTRNSRKLKRGAHAANVFRLVVRLNEVHDDLIADRLKKISTAGVPNYFGPQRFGRCGNNLQLAHAVFAGKRLKREQQSMAISAARSFLFNEVLAARVAAGSWNEILDGDVVNLAGTASYFVPDAVDGALKARLESFDVHPTGPMWGRSRADCSGPVADTEKKVGDANAELVAGLERIGARTDRRALRLVPHELDWNLVDHNLEIQFQLGKGTFATSVLRELMTTPDE